MPDQDSTIRIIPLTKGKFAVVDAADFERVNQFKWHATRVKKSNKWYASRNDNGSHAMRCFVLMHRFIIGALDGFQIDHRDRDGLNNRRSNLRVATQSQNLQNTGKQRNNTSGHKGVTWHKRRQKWQASFMVNKRTVYLGLFTELQDAANAYIEAAKKHNGEFASW